MRKPLALILAAPLFLQAADDEPERLGWPRMLEADGVTIVAYQPQIDKWDDHRRLEVQMALSCTMAEQKEPHLAALRIRARTDVDFSARTVEISSAKITSLEFPDADPKDVAKYRKVIRQRLEGRTWTNSLDRMLALAGQPGQEQREVRVSTLAPPVYYSETDAVLVQYMGEPAFERIPGTRLRYAVNTNWDVITVDGKPETYLLFEDGWLFTRNLIEGPWEPAGELPDEFQLLPKDENWSSVRAKVPGKAIEKPPVVFVSLRPAELILVDGEAKMEAIEGTKLTYVLNCDESVFHHEGDGRWYFLVAGRWFESPELKNLASWQPVRDLPEDFAKIPPDHEMADVRAMVTGTPEADEAVLQASIPRMASVERKGTTIEVVYDGEPEFAPVEGVAGLEYALNTPSDVFRYRGVYYGCENGVWFEARGPNGPWAPCAMVPDALYEIPGENPKHHCVYVRIYDSNDDVIVYGYTGGYYGLYYWRRRVWFGYGYWWGFHQGLKWHRRYAWLHRPVHYAYGMGARYSPYRAGFVRGAHAYGPYGGVGRSAAYDPRAKAYVRSTAAYGQRDGRLASTAYTPAARAYARTRKATSVYGTWGGKVTARDDQWAAMRRQERRATTSARAAQAGLRPAPGRADDVFVGKDGRIYRQNDRGWQVKAKSGWQAFDPNRRPEPRAEPTKRPTTRPATADRQQVHRDLDRQAQARRRGHAQATHYSRARATPSYSRRASGYRRSAGYRGGGARGGGRGGRR